MLVALFAALTAVGAFLKIPMLLAPFTLQTLFSMLAGMLLGPWLGALSQILYIAIGLIGIPVFAGNVPAGPGYILQPTFGYLIGMIAGAFVCGLIVKKAKKLTFFKVILAALSCTFIVYAIGLPYLFLMKNFYLQAKISYEAAAVYGFLVFIPGDLLKCVIATFATVKLRPILERQRLIGVR